MLRVWPLLLALAAACKGDSAAGDPDRPAGKVIELSGKVEAAREGAAVRPLAVGTPVSGRSRSARRCSPTTR